MQIDEIYKTERGQRALRQSLKKHLLANPIARDILKRLKRDELLLMKTQFTTTYQAIRKKKALSIVSDNQTQLKKLLKSNKEKLFVMYVEDDLPAITFGFDRLEFN